MVSVTANAARFYCRGRKFSYLKANEGFFLKYTRDLSYGLNDEVVYRDLLFQLGNMRSDTYNCELIMIRDTSDVRTSGAEDQARLCLRRLLYASSDCQGRCPAVIRSVALRWSN
jgi:hypothetical protein